MLRRVLIIGVLLALGAAPGSAQDEPGAPVRSDGFFLSNIAPEGIDGEFLRLAPDPNEYEINLQLSPGLGLMHNFQRSEVEVFGAAFDTGIQEFASTTATLSLQSRTSLAFTREETTIQDVTSQMMRRSEVTGMSLTQGFGAGSSEGGLSLTRAMQTEATPDNGELRTLSHSLDLQTGIGDGAQLQALATRKESQEPGRLWEEGYEGHLTAALSGGEGTAHYEFLQRLVEGEGQQHRRLDIVAPFAMRGGTALAEHHSLHEWTETTSKEERTTAFSLPLAFLRDGATANYQEDAQITDGVRKQKSTLAFAAPMSLLGHKSQVEHICTETINGDSIQEDRTLRLTAQFDEGPGTLERTETVIPTEDGLQRRRLMLVQSPKIGLGNALTLAAGHRREDVVGVESTRTSHLDLIAKPLEPLDISANYRVHDLGEGVETKDHVVQTVLALSESASLRGSISQIENVEGSPAIVRHLELQRAKHSEHDLGARFGYTTYGAQEEDAEPTMLAQLTVGDDTKLSLNATYTEYHEKKLGPLEEATTSVELRAGDPARLGLRAAYTDQAGRAGPERRLGLAMMALGGSLRLDYARNPLGPRGREVLLTELYELGFQRKIFGSVGLDLGYKFCDATDTSDHEHYLKLQLDGGHPERGGQIALSYLSGHFVPHPGSEDPASSLLDVSYEKRWPGSGRLTLTLSRETPPELTVGIDDHVEAEVKYQTNF
jgi:hypothetical protein